MEASHAYILQTACVVTSTRPTGFRRFRHAPARFVATCFPCLQTILAVCTNADIINSIRASIAIAGHDVLTFAFPALFPFATLEPERPPLLEGKQKLDATSSGGRFLPLISDHYRMSSSPCPDPLTRFFAVGASPCSHSLAIAGAHLFKVGGAVGACVRGKPLRSAIFGVSHWFLSCKAMVRDGISAATLMPFRYITHGTLGHVQ